jgi:outer membrane protein assembly factor BamA
VIALLLALSVAGSRPAEPAVESETPAPQAGVEAPTRQGAMPNPSGQASAERVAEIRVHGNATLSDAAVIALAGVAPGDAVDEAALGAIEKRLRDSGRFDDVEVRKRYRTLEMTDVALVLLVHERPGLSATGQPPGFARRLRSKLMFFPILDYEDGYGWTYGGRTSLVDVFDKGTHVMVPLSWGGSRNAQVEVDHTFASGPLTRVTGAYGILQRENPHYLVDDRRTGLHGRVERRLFDLVTVGADLARTDVTFGGSLDRVWTPAADATVDTRRDPAYPLNAVFASAAWNRLNPVGTASFGTSGIDRYSLDARGYARVFRQNVLAVRAHFDTASAPLPPYDQWLLGGTSLRGLDAGTFAGDKRLFWAAELRVPVTTPLDAGRLGVNAFFEGGATAAYGEAISSRTVVRDAGGGVWLTFAIFRLNFDVAHSLDGYGTRFHFGTGFSF